MHRTGINLEESDELLDKLFNSSEIKFKGIHGYDGHLVGLTDIEEKQEIVNKSIDIVEEFRNKISKFSQDQNYDIIVGGSWSFQYYLNKTEYKVSPGTWIYWDSNNIRQPDLNFKVAGLILGQVIDEDKIRKTVTVDIGAKSVSCDALTPDRFTIEGKPKAKLLHITFVEAYYPRGSGRIGGAGTYVKNIADELLVIFKNAKKFGPTKQVFYSADPSGKSSYTDIYLDINNEYEVAIGCYDWSDELLGIKEDHLGLSLRTKDLSFWLN